MDNRAPIFIAGALVHDGTVGLSQSALDEASNSARIWSGRPVQA